MRIIVSDTGPLLHLAEAGLLDLLQRAGKVYIPQEVHSELQALSESWKRKKPEWIDIKPLGETQCEESRILYESGMLGKGEAEAIILAKKLKADWFLTDDIEARIFARSIGLEVHGSLGVVLWAAVEGYLNYESGRSAIDNLSKTSLWISQRIIDKAYQALKQIFSGSHSKC
mgnify:CR=1 FL=1